MAALTRQGYMEIARGTTLLGFTATDTLAGLLLATKVATKATLPGGHAINLVTDARWELLPLDSSSSATNHPTIAAEEQEFWKSMQQHTVGGVHYYCETADLTRPFPSSFPPTEPELEFIWNAWLSQPLRDLGLHTHCPQLMQGAVESVDEVHPVTGQRYTLCLLSRRSRRHPGTRYIARGLNKLAGPGNEIEAELLMWTPSAGSGSSINSGSGGGGVAVKWARIYWRRGTVPIWWGVDLQPLNRGLQAEVYVKAESTYVGTLSYVRALQKLTMADALGSSGRCGAGHVESTNSDVAKVTFINLLHCNPKKVAELMLSTHFEEGMALVKDRLAAGKKKTTTTTEDITPSCPAPSLKKFDWHGVMAMLNEEQGIEAFWTFIEHSVKNTGLALGVMERRRSNTSDKNTTYNGTNTTNSNSNNSNGSTGDNNNIEDITRWGERWQMKWIQRQRGLLRFNCADSLDRTNAATCFAMLPALQEGLRLLGINLENTVAGGGGASPLQAGAATLLASSSRSSLHQENKELDEEEEEDMRASQSGKEREEEEGGEQTVVEVMPEGWERREHAGRAVYIDHVNKVTQWDPPVGTTTTTKRTTKAKENSTSSSSSTTVPAPLPDSISPPWVFFNYRLEDVRSKLYADTVADYVTMFRKHGDVHSALYTGSPAMHSHVLGLVLSPDARPYGSSSSSVGKLQNLRVAVQRRWNNTVSDTARQQSMELFLGLNLYKYFPRVRSVVPPHPTIGVQNDLAGIDEDDTLTEEEELGAAHVAAELESLNLRKHDGRVGVAEPLEETASPVMAAAVEEEEGLEAEPRVPSSLSLSDDI